MRTTILVFLTVLAAFISSSALALDTLVGGQQIGQGQSLVSAGGKIILTLQGDGNLVAYTVLDHKPVWATTSNNGAVLRMQTDGNLILATASNGLVWSSGTYGNPGARFVVQDDANLVVYTPSNAAPWYSAMKGWNNGPNLLYKNGYLYCTGTSRNPAGAQLNWCIANTPQNWTMLLDAATYYIENEVQVVVNKPMTLSVNGGWGNSSPCFNVPSIANPDGGMQGTGAPCAQLVASNNAQFGWGGFFIMGNPSGGTTSDSQGYPIPNYAQIANVNVDHIILNGNYGGRTAALQGNGLYQKVVEFVNGSAIACNNCSFTNGGSAYSVGGGFALEYNTDAFLADHNAYFDHGNLQEMTNGKRTPRHAGCAFVAGNGSRFTNNYVRNCADEAVLVTAENGQVQNNAFYARDLNYSSTMIRIQGANSNESGLKVIYNWIDCGGDAECTTGITVGSNQFDGALVGSGSPAFTNYIFSGNTTAGVQVQYNTIVGVNIGILVGFEPLAGNAVYIWGNAITPVGFGKPFLPMACKQWYGSRSTYNCCNANWDTVRMPNWVAPWTNQSMSVGGNRIIGTTIMIDPRDATEVYKDYNNTPMVYGTDAYPAAWIGGGGGADDSASCF